MVCAGINPLTDREFDRLLRREKGTDLTAYLAGIIDVRPVEPRYIGSPLANTETIDAVEQPCWPSTDWIDYDSPNESIAWAQADGKYCGMIHNGNIFESTWFMCGLEQTLMDLVMNPEPVQAILEHVTGFFIRHFMRILEVADGQVELAFTADDIGGQRCSRPR